MAAVRYSREEVREIEGRWIDLAMEESDSRADVPFSVVSLGLCSCVISSALGRGE